MFHLILVRSNLLALAMFDLNNSGLEKSATLLAYLLSKLINEQGGFFRLLHEELRAGWKVNLKSLSEQAFLLGTSE